MYFIQKRKKDRKIHNPHSIASLSISRIFPPKGLVSYLLIELADE